MGIERVPAAILSLGLLFGSSACNAGTAGNQASASEFPSPPGTIRPVDVDGELFARTTGDGTRLRVFAKGRVPDCAMLTVQLGEERFVDHLYQPVTGDLVVTGAMTNYVLAQVGAAVRTVVWRDASGAEIDRMTPVNGVAVLGRHVQAPPLSPGVPAPPPPRGGTDLGTVLALGAGGEPRAEADARGRLMIGGSCQ